LEEVRGLSVQQVAFYLVCVFLCGGGALCGCGQRELNGCCFKNHSFLMKFTKLILILTVLTTGQLFLSPLSQ
jgi:hypothetical protein